MLAETATAQQADRVQLQLMWRHQAQFAGVYVALHKGFYARERLRVELGEGGPGINPIDFLAGGGADAALAWLPTAVDARTRGRDVVNVAQILRRPGIAVACRRDAGVQSTADVAGKSIGVWGVGDELDIRHWLRTAGISLESVALVPQRADGLDLIERRVPCASVMMYNEYWSLLRAGIAASDLLTIRLADAGLGFLEDGLYVNAAALRDAQRYGVLVRFVRATLSGWRYARDNPEEALQIVLAATPQSDPAHQRRMLDSVLQLIGDADKIGLLDLPSYARSLAIIAGDGGPGALARTAAIGWTHQVWQDAKPGGRALLELTEATRHYLKTAVSSRWFYALDLIGTVAFGFAGFMRAQQRRYDLWGAFILTLLPAAGGGTLRDLLIGGDRSPPFIFTDPTYVLVVLGTVATGTLVSRWLTPQAVGSRSFERTLAVFDTVGLATFTVIGAQVAIIAGLYWLWVPFCAALTCAGGGMLLDVVTGREPRTFQGEPYEEIAVFGGLLLLLGLNLADEFEHTPQLVTATIVLTLLSVFALRMLVVAFKLRSYRLGEPKPAA